MGSIPITSYGSNLSAALADERRKVLCEMRTLGQQGYDIAGKLSVAQTHEGEHSLRCNSGVLERVVHTLSRVQGTINPI